MKKKCNQGNKLLPLKLGPFMIGTFRHKEKQDFINVVFLVKMVEISIMCIYSPQYHKTIFLKSSMTIYIKSREL